MSCNRGLSGYILSMLDPHHQELEVLEMCQYGSEPNCLLLLTAAGKALGELPIGSNSTC